MLSSLFNYDNPVWRFIGKFFDVMILNLLWVYSHRYYGRFYNSGLLCYDEAGTG